jgi:hypothetical protein
MWGAVENPPWWAPAAELIRSLVAADVADELLAAGNHSQRSLDEIVGRIIDDVFETRTRLYEAHADLGLIGQRKASFKTYARAAISPDILQVQYAVHVRDSADINVPRQAPGRLPQYVARSVGTPAAVALVQKELSRSQMGLTQFANATGTTDRTLRKFLKEGKARRSTVEGIAEFMGLSLEQLLHGDSPLNG